MRALSLAALLLLAGCKTLGDVLPVVGESALVTACQRYQQAASFLDSRLAELSDGQLIEFSTLDRLATRRCIEEQTDPAAAAATVDSATAEVQAIAELLP